MDRYNFKSSEEKWQKIWNEKNIFKTDFTSDKPKCYVLEMFPYPSGRIHMGHVRNYTIGDAYARFKKANGYKVIHPMGWDAFGMPAENAAMSRNIHPKDWTYENIASMRAEFKRLGLSFDWDCEVTTCSPDYYKHEQKMFLDFLKNDLVYQKEAWVNWDPVDQTVLANEQVVDGCGWQSGAPVERKKLSQWFLKITDYADPLLEELDNLKGWPEKVLLMQNNWIGKSIGASVQFPITNSSENIEVFTTRPDTLFGASFIGLSPQHPIALKLAEENEQIAAFIKECESQGTSETTIEQAEKKGIDTGLTVQHPFDDNWQLPIYIANFVLMEYGTGAIFACPAHDKRDFEFAQKYDLPIRQVVQSPEGETELPYVDDGTIVNSKFLDGLEIEDAKNKAIGELEKKSLGEKKITYRLRDWGVSRQRYWGCPIPIIHCPSCGVVPVPEDQLPVTLPEDVTFDKRGNPLNNHPTWKHVSCPKCGADAERETDTFDTFFESSWYFLRFCSPKSEQAMDRDLVNEWCPVDHYIGGIEHAVMHLLYSRFFTRALRKCGYLDFDEPFTNLLTQGMVCLATYQDQDGNWLYPEEVTWNDNKQAVKTDDGTPVKVGRITKMSKSKKNVVDPQQIIASYGADTARLFILSDTPVERDFEWSDSGVEGCWRFLNRLWRIVMNRLDDIPPHNGQMAFEETEAALALRKKSHKTIKIVSEDYEHFRMNCVIARIRELANEIDSYKTDQADAALREALEILVKLCQPIMPHIADELWQALGHDEILFQTDWPTYDEALVKDDLITIAVQVKGKLRGTIDIAPDSSQDEIQNQALALENVQKMIADQEIKKVIYVPKKIVNIVI